jgi:transglutaminase-like putative cysteine protease
VKRIAAFLTLIFILPAPLISAGRSDYDKKLDCLLKEQRERAGFFAEDSIQDNLFAPLENGRLTNEELADYRFLLAYLPLGDFPTIPAEVLLENIHLAREARQRFPWGYSYDDTLYRHFVLPLQISQEPFLSHRIIREPYDLLLGWREFLEELTPRIVGLTMTDAALEVNHWCREKATYRPTDARDQDPLTTIRAGFGRCEEEMILAIAALRSVGIPARQCYTPYWAHCDNNHAWVEVWTDGAWHYFGACEPAPTLDNAWFTSAAKRAMLVISSAYGDYEGDEPILKRYHRSTLINSTAVYGDTKSLEIRLLKPNCKPAADTRLIFNLFNYGALMPALALQTDADGICRLDCGRGDWIITAGNDKWSGIFHIPADSESVSLQLTKRNKACFPESIDYNPPPQVDAAQPSADSLFQCRLLLADSTRERNINTEIDFRYQQFREVNGRFNLFDTLIVPTLLSKARGNAEQILRYLFNGDPSLIPSFSFWPLTLPEANLRLTLLQTLSDKDLFDFDAGWLNFHFYYTFGWTDTLRYHTIWDSIQSLDSIHQELYKECVINPRIDLEPSAGYFDSWRSYLSEFTQAHPKLGHSNDDQRMIKWLRKNISVESNPDRLGPPLLPDMCLLLRRGTQGDVERLYIALCRVRGIPARRNPVTDRVEIWRDDAWREISLSSEKQTKSEPGKSGSLTVSTSPDDSLAASTLYFRDWAVQRWETDHLEAVDFGYQKPFREITWPQELPSGKYCLVSGLRRADGSAPVKLRWFELPPTRETTIPLQF